MKTDSERRHGIAADTACLLVCCAVSLLQSLPVLASGFSAEDCIWLHDARDLQSPMDAFSVHRAAFAPHDGTRLSPTELAFFWFGLRFGGVSPLPLHVGVSLLAAMNGFVLYIWIRRLTSSRLAGAAAAAAFLFQPCHAEVLGWLSAVNEALLGLFTLLTLLAWDAWRTRAGAPWLALSLLAYVAALLTKASAIALAPTLLVLDLVLGRLSRPRDWLAHAPQWLLLSLVVAWASGSHLNVPGADNLPLGGIGVVATVVRNALAMLVGDATTRGLPPFMPGSQEAHAVAWSLLLLLPAIYAAACWRLTRISRPLVFHLLWLPLAIAPYALVCSLGVLSDRYLWTASLASCGALGCVAAALRGRRLRAIGALAVSLLVATQAPTLQAGVQRFERPDDTADLREQVAAALAQRAPNGRVFVYQPAPGEHTSGCTVALLGDLDDRLVRDWYDVLSPPGLRPGDIMLYWDEADRAFSDLTLSVPRALQGRRLSQKQLGLSWDFHQPAERDAWTFVGAAANAPVYSSTSASDMLVSPPLQLTPFDASLVVVELRVLSGRWEDVCPSLAWASPREGGQGPARMVPRSMSVKVRADGMTFLYAPPSRPRWWSEEGATSLYLPISNTPATIEIERILVLAGQR